MTDTGKVSGSLPTEAATTEQRVILVESLLVTWKVLDQPRDKGLIPQEGAKDEGVGTDAALRSLVRAGCCKPYAALLREQASRRNNRPYSSMRIRPRRSTNAAQSATS